MPSAGEVERLWKKGAAVTALGSKRPGESIR